jgi:hypothetical protein
VWTVVAWGAFRNSFGCTRLRALAATSVWLAILLTLTQLAALAGRSL